MSNSQEELELTRAQLARAERALEAIRRDILPVSEARYRLMAEGYVEQIQRLRTQLDAYLGIDTVPDSRSNKRSTEVTGVIREVDLDKRTFCLRERPEERPDLDCEYDEANEDAVNAYLDEPVVVTGVLRTSRKTEKQTMEVESIAPDLPSETAPLAEPTESR